MSVLNNSLKEFSGMLSIIQLSKFFVVTISDNFYILSWVIRFVNNFFENLLFSFCFQPKALSYYHAYIFMSSVFLIFFNIFCMIQIQTLFGFERRRRDLNPRAATNDLLPFQGSPFGQLGYFSKLPFGQKNGEGGIRTHAPSRTNGFQDRLVMTTSIPLH